MLRDDSATARRKEVSVVEITNKPIRVLVEVRSRDGSVSYEWREVPGTEMSFEGGGVGLKNGETLQVTYDVLLIETR